MPILHQDVPIANGASLSAEIDIGDRVVCAVEIPVGYTGTAVSFAAAQRSTAEGGTYVPVVDKTGAEVTLTVAAGKVTLLDPNTTRPFRNIKLVSGTNATPVAQGGARLLNIVTIEGDRV
jgi:hypothetical protein